MTATERLEHASATLDAVLDCICDKVNKGREVSALDLIRLRDARRLERLAMVGEGRGE